MPSRVSSAPAQDTLRTGWPVSEGPPAAASDTHDPFEGLHEHLRRLGTGHREPAVEEVERHAADAEIPRLGVFVAYGLHALVRVQPRPDVVLVHAQLAGDARQHALSLMAPMLAAVIFRETFVPVGAKPFDIPALMQQHIDTVLPGLLTKKPKP